PEEARDTLRMISIGDYDLCACIGIHVGNTSEIGKFKIISSDFEKHRLRIRFKLEKQP
ncbi:MAG: alanine-tRNA synthetase second additional domain-containing protein, partial [Odoribacter sp.]|nr:alanine-tRNA synthetase second additional domain-containing protein [Odoribacter sp.]